MPRQQARSLASWLPGYKRDYKCIEAKRFDEYKAKNQCEPNRRYGSWIACHSF